jgi:carboxyl-terminal processing protease
MEPNWQLLTVQPFLSPFPPTNGIIFKSLRTVPVLFSRRSLIVLNRFSVVLALTISLFIASPAVAQDESARVTSNGSATAAAPASEKKVTLQGIGSEVAEALSVIESNHVVGKSIDYNRVFKASIDSMLHTLDPHSNYFDAKEFDQFRTDQSSRYFGIGATIGDLSDAEGEVQATFIRSTFENAPAHRAGLRYGDKIVEINGKNVLGKPFTEVRDHLRGPRGTAAKIVVERHGTGQRQTVEIVRDAVAQPSIAESYMIRPGVGYIAMTGGFNQTTFAEFAEAMQALKAKGMTQLILDLKNNGGGLVGQAYRVANTFLARGQTVFTQKGRLQGMTEPYRAENPAPETLPVVVLVNRNSASASEILAGALQDHDRALIVGETTFGKGLVQNPFELDYGSMLLLTIAKYETPSGRLIQRDYSDGNLYNYYTKGGIGREESDSDPAPNGEALRTGTGRIVYSGGGISPDVSVKPDTIPIERARFQQKLNNPIFAYALDVVYGQSQEFPGYKIDRPINFAYDLKESDFPVTEKMFNSFKSFAVRKYNFTPAQIDAERTFIERALRSEFVTAAYGTTTSFQVFNEYDNQLMRAIELLPQARQLAMEGAKAYRSSAGGLSNNR